jgi:hypothetical protein
MPVDLANIKIEASSKSANKAARELADAFGIERSDANTPSKKVKDTIERALEKYQTERKKRKALSKKLRMIQKQIDGIADQL